MTAKGDDIDEHDLDLELDPERDDDNDVSTFRATFAGGRLTLNDWVPALAHGGPLGNHFRDRTAEGVAIADVTLVRTADGEPEAIVRFMTGGDRRPAEDALVSWARLAGHRRIWLEDRVVDMGDDLPESGSVEVTCPTCAMRWEEQNHEFRTYVRSQGVFPNFCPLCGGTLPQWRLATGAGASKNGQGPKRRRTPPKHGPRADQTRIREERGPR